MQSAFRRIISAELATAVVLLVAAALAGTSAAEHRRSSLSQAANAARPRYAEADSRFMQGMIAHHAQAIAMAALVPARSGRQDMRLLAQRIDVSQKDEIAMMRRWLEERGLPVPAEGADHQHHDAGSPPMRMPGMLSPEEMAVLAAASGPGFDRLFLEGMIKHHQGARAMVKELFGAGGGQDPLVFRFASDVDTDQRAEIARMAALLGNLP